MAAFERYVALRYLFGAQGREEGRRFLRFITYVAVGGVAMGVAALLLALSIVRGFSHEIEAKIIGFGAHVQVESYLDAPLDNAAQRGAELAAWDGVVHVSPVITEFTLLRHAANEIDGVALWGTDALPGYLAENLQAGTARFTPDSSGQPGLVIGKKLARTLRLDVGDRVTAFSMRGLQGAAPAALVTGARPRIKQFRVAGIYETALADFDELYVFTDIEEARALLEYAPDEVTRFDLTLADVSRATETAEDIAETMGFPILSQSIYQVFRSLFAWVNLQESIIPLVIGVIIIVAAFNIVATLLMVILEKTREIGVLAGMGASQRSLRRLFLWLGLFIGAVGTGLGMALAGGLAWLQLRYALIPLPEDAYYMDRAPVAINPIDFVLVAGVTLVLCALAAYIPARVASRVDPLKVIRFS